MAKLIAFLCYLIILLQLLALNSISQIYETYFQLLNENIEIVMCVTRVDFRKS